MHLFGHTFDHDYYFELLREGGAGRPINYSMFYFTPSRCPGCPACEPNVYRLLILKASLRYQQLRIRQTR
jgi:hypothetical protein